MDNVLKGAVMNTLAASASFAVPAHLPTGLFRRNVRKLIDSICPAKG